jgi:hypothetical protein
MLSQGALLERTRDIPKKPEWVVKGLYFTSDCFRCANKIKYEFKGFNVRILCSDNCNYKPAYS